MLTGSYIQVAELSVQDICMDNSLSKARLRMRTRPRGLRMRGEQESRKPESGLRLLRD